MQEIATICKVLAFFCLTQATLAVKEWNDLRVRFDIFKSMGFHQMPTSTSSRSIKSYVKVEPEEGFNFPLDFYCQPNDPRACLMFDKQGNVAGLQMSFLKADVANVDPNDYDYKSNPNFVETNFFGKPAFSFRAYFTNPETLTESGRTNSQETADGLFMYLEGKLVEIPREQPKEDRFGDFYKQGCLRSMGLHYFYKLDSSINDCRQLFPIFPLYEDGFLVGYGFVTYGKGTRGPSREWYEHPPKLALSIIAPRRGQCVDQLHDKYQMTSMHVYFVKRPWDIACNCLDKVISAATDWIPF